MTSRTFDRRQFLLLLTLLRTLGSRRELTSQFGMHGPALGIIAGLGLLMGALIALIVASTQIPAREVPIVCQTLTALVLIPLLVSEAADALLNPAEVSVLAHRPVGSLSYLAAKVTYVLGFALTIAWSFNILPALAGLRLAETAWFYPMTHMAAASLGAIVTTLVTCGVFGVLFRVVPVSRVRSVALWVQMLGGLIVPMAPHLSRLLNFRPDIDAPYWSAIPVSWFASLALAGQAAAPSLDMRLALPAMLVSLGLVALGFRALTQGYMARVSTAVRSRRPSARRRRSAWLARVLRWLADGRAGAGAGLFVLKMGTRDWQFRRATFRGLVPMLLLIVFVLGRGLRSPFGDGPGFTTAHLLPHMIGIAVMNAADFLPFSDHYKARWILLTAPASGLRGVVRGTVAALWLMGVIVPSLVIFGATSALWNVADAAVFSAYCAAVMSFYVGAFAWLQAGLPFTRRPDPARAAANMTAMFGFLIVALVLGVIQAIWLFPHHERVVAATAVLALAGWLAARVSIRILENRVPDHLRRFTDAPARMFSIVEDTPP